MLPKTSALHDAVTGGQHIITSLDKGKIIIENSLIIFLTFIILLSSHMPTIKNRRITLAVREVIRL